MDAQRDQDAHRMRLLSRRLMNARASPLVEKENAGNTDTQPREARGRKADRDRASSVGNPARVESNGSSGPSSRRGSRPVGGDRWRSLGAETRTAGKGK